MSPTHISRRSFLRAAAVTAGGMLAACGPRQVVSDVPVEPEGGAGGEATNDEAPTAVPKGASAGSVVYWVSWPESPYGDAWKELQQLDSFKELLGDSTFELKPGVAEDAILTSVAGGAPPDGASNYNYMDYMLREVLLPLDSYIAASKTVKKEDFLEAVWDVGVYNGKNYGLPANECFVQLGFVYNSKLVKDAGLDPETPPQTYDELYEWHKAITKFDSTGNVKTIGYNPTDFMGQTIWGSSAWDVSTAWGFEWYDEQAKTFNFNNDNLIDYFNTSKKFVDLVGIDKLAALASVEGQGEWGPAYYSGVLASMLDGYWAPGEMASISPELSDVNRCTWMPVPTSRKGTKAQGAGGHIVMVFKDGKNQELMYKISEFLTTPDACDIIFKKVGWLPARKSFLDKVDPKTYNGLEFFLRSSNEADSWGHVVKCPITTYVGTVYPQLREQVYRGEMTSEQAAAELQKRAEEELKNQGFA